MVLAVRLFAEYTKLDKVESCFNQNKRVCENKRFWGRGRPIDRFYRMLVIYEFISAPQRYVKAGLVSETELKAVPVTLKRWVLWPYYLTYIWAIAMIVWSVWYWWCDIPT